MLPSRWRNLTNQLPEGVQLLAVSKGQPASSIRQLVDLGQRDFGESRLQEALLKFDSLADCPELRWHFIGRLQSNKVRAVVRSFSVIHSLDSESLLMRVSRIAVEEKRNPQALLQVKFRDDPTKGGFDPIQLLEAWPNLVNLQNLNLIGLMTMAPMQLSLNEKKELFRECRTLADQLGLEHCSMGMSSDWKEAIEAGATWIRLGSMLFGSRSVG